MLRFWTVLLVALLASGSAMARGHTHLFLGFNFAPAPYYYGPPAYYYAPPVYYAPPPVYYAPPPAAYYAPPQPRNCQTFNGDASIDASGAPFYGTACLQADGRWHIVN